MKRKIRSVILVGVMVLSILLLSTQPVQAGPVSTVFRVPNYSGHITLEPIFIYDSSANGLRQVITLTATGALHFLFYDSPGDYATILFEPYQILITDDVTDPNVSIHHIMS